MSKIVFDRANAEDYLARILSGLPDGFTIRLLLDKNDEPNSWICLGDMELSRATQVINSAMVEQLHPTPKT